MKRLQATVRGAAAQERGSALIEFVVLAVVLLIPCLYLVITLGSVQSAVFAADVLARDAARIHATQSDPVQADARVQRLQSQLLEDYGLDPDQSLEVLCSASPCATPGGQVTVSVSISVPIPGLGPLLGEGGPFRVRSSHLVEVDQFRASGGAR
ncbi:hypothetical protein Bequi_11085 [Brachybacterium sp. JHP9]|uniref:Pilus assembly protein TadE n=1 Tax=Brachybacterium equifaecis TaxID=2910770 RepID=A0ABT0R1V1_9MICO|nr:hypothetical protein [Brachybacterium equifaecis]